MRVLPINLIIFSLIPFCVCDMKAPEQSMFVETYSNELSNVDPTDIVFAMPLNFTSPDGQSFEAQIRMKSGGDSLKFVQELANLYDLDWIKSRWVLRQIDHTIHRLEENEVLRFDYSDGSDKRFEPLSIRFGDDISLLVRLYGFKNRLSHTEIENIYSTVLEHLGRSRHHKIDWINARRSHILKGNIMPKKKIVRATETCRISLVISITTGSFRELNNVVSKFPSTDLICEVTVVDAEHATSKQDMMQMIESFYEFNFVFKTKHSRDLEVPLFSTLNAAMEVASSNYVMYITDTMEPITYSDYHLRSALTIFEANLSSKHPLAQIGLNDVGNGGWKREVQTENGFIEYIEHEFGSMNPEHFHSSSRPGFTLNQPSIWDSDALNSFNLKFEGSNVDTFSLSVWDAGLSTANLYGSINYKNLS